MIPGSVITHTLFGQTFLLLPQKALIWQNESALLVSDVHLGKVGHFRKAGIAIPKSMEQEDLAMLSDLINEYKPEKLIFLGDLFHSDLNNDWAWLMLWRDLYRHVEMHLVLGNHDILQNNYYKEAGFILHKQLEIGPFLFSHEPLKAKELASTERYVLSGHLHPGVRLHGKGRQSVTLPCFHFGSRQGILPAFGRFTGKVCLKSGEQDQVFGVMKHSVVAL